MVINSKCLVTGANGFTGGHFCAYLASRGVSTRGMYYPPDGVPELNHEALEWVPGDVRDEEAVRRAVAGADVIFHIAALYRPTNVSKQDYWDVNVEGTRRLLKLAADAGARRFVHCSTIGVHGHIDRPPADESAPIRPDDYYQYTKLKGEEAARRFGEESGLPVSIVRPAAIYGPKERRFLKLADLISRRRFIMFGHGEVPYHFVHVDDLSDAFVKCAERGEAIGQTYIIADDHAITLNRILAIVAGALGVPPPRMRLPLPMLTIPSVLCELICKPLGVSPPLHRRRASWFWAPRSFDIGKARRELDYSPHVAVERGLTEMVESYIEAGWIQRTKQHAMQAM